MDGASPHQKCYWSYCPQVNLLNTDTFKTENVYAMVTRPVHSICDPARLSKTAIGGTGENSISIF